MSREATIIDSVDDVFGSRWDVREYRPTPPHKWSIAIGWPEGHRGKGCGGPRTIITPELAAHLEAHRYDNFEAYDLPVGRGVIKRIRRIMGFNRYADREIFWQDRIIDLANMSGEAFAKKYNCSEGAVSKWHKTLIGRKNRPAGWWRAENVKNIIATNSTAQAAEILGISAGSVRRIKASAG